MTTYEQLFDNNRRWVAETSAADPEYFSRLAEEQRPRFLFIGCSDSRVPADRITGTEAGEMFVHRNIANVVVPNDINLMSVLQYAIEVLPVEHIIVCGHYGCGGVNAALDEKPHGLVDNWLRNIRRIYLRHLDELDAIDARDDMLRRLCEWNVIEQVMNVGATTVVQDAWKRGQTLNVHGWIYDVSDGLLKDMDVKTQSVEDL
ncbi:MAG: carbonate dehydratase, partial [Verrucomicrobiales bacterium]|nr:carbonate dehydratase [Verrucomicrobiales bacterium]